MVPEITYYVLGRMTNQLMVSQVADWSTCKLINSLSVNF